MKPVYIAQETGRRRAIQRRVRWWKVLPGLFAVALVAGIAWPGHASVIPLLAPVALTALAIYLFVILVGARRVRFGPVNYRSLSLSDAGLEYEPLSKQRFSIDWKEIESIEFCREEAAFADLDGPYLETMWLITKRGGGRKTDVMDEDNNRAHLVSAFRECLPGFDMAEAERAFRSANEGKWLCFNRSASMESHLQTHP
jgi:hypothetical protein